MFLIFHHYRQQWNGTMGILAEIQRLKQVVEVAIKIRIIYTEYYQFHDDTRNQAPGEVGGKFYLGLLHLNGSLNFNHWYFPQKVRATSIY